MTSTLLPIGRSAEGTGVRRTLIRSIARPRRVAAALALAVLGACGDFEVTNPNQPTLDDLLQSPTRSKLAAAATGLFIGARDDIQQLIWRLGSMGREGINLAGNNQPDYQEPYYGPITGSQFGGEANNWRDRYANIRSINVYLDALSRATGLSAEEVSASAGLAKTLKALAFMYVVETRGDLGAPVDVGTSVSDPPAPFVSEDSVYGYALALLDEARTDLQAGGTSFPFPIPPGLGDFGTPATFVPFNRALAARLLVFRGTAGCGDPCFTAALTALGESFISDDPAAFATGAYFDFSSSAGDVTNDLSEPLNGVTYFALADVLSAGAQQQSNGDPDQRLLDKVAPKEGDPQILAAIPIPGTVKFTRYFVNGEADASAPIPIIRNEELILLRAEANIHLGNATAAIADLNLVRENAGNLQPTTLTAGSGESALITELLYNRRYSLLWEQGTSWLDARRYGRLDTIPAAVPGGNVPPRILVPDAECSARGLASGCAPLAGQ
jgi:hypothetical protein